MRRSLLRDVPTTAAIAAAGVGGTTMLLSTIETGKPFAALNATSHIVWGESAFSADDPDLEHTVPSLLLNSWAMLQWSGLSHFVTRRVRRMTPSRAIAVGAGVSAFAWVLDYVVLPKRLTPGIEERLSKPATLAVFAALAGSLALGLWRSR